MLLATILEFLGTRNVHLPMEYGPQAIKSLDSGLQAIESPESGFQGIKHLESGVWAIKSLEFWFQANGLPKDMHFLQQEIIWLPQEICLLRQEMEILPYDIYAHVTRNRFHSTRNLHLHLASGPQAIQSIESGWQVVIKPLRRVGGIKAIFRYMGAKDHGATFPKAVRQVSDQGKFPSMPQWMHDDPLDALVDFFSASIWDFPEGRGCHGRLKEECSHWPMFMALLATWWGIFQGQGHLLSDWLWRGNYGAPKTFFIY
jgi:hypothetical protein